MNIPAIKTYSCSGSPGHDHTVHTLTQVLDNQRYDDDRAAISLLQPGDKHVDVDGDVWERKT